VIFQFGKDESQVDALKLNATNMCVQTETVVIGSKNYTNFLRPL